MQPEERFFGFVLVIATVVVSTFLGLLLPVDLIFALTSEGAVIEDLSACLWLVLGTLIVITALRDAPELTPAAALAFLAGARELDAHLRFTSEDISNLSYWSDAATSLKEKIVVCAIILPIAAYLLYAILFCWSKFRAHVLRRDPAAYSLLALILFILVLRIIDHLPTPVTFLTNDSTILMSLLATLRAIEELGELALPVLGLLTLWQYERGLNRAGFAGGSNS